jgi:diguanylate cyclase (GGDEF)-like protein/PAS domain S-box-containing protein
MRMDARTGSPGINEDVTARKDAEERVWQSDSRFRSLLALSSDWYWEQDAQLKFTEVAGMDSARDRLDITQLLGETSLEQGNGVNEADLTRYKSLTAARQPFKDIVQTVRDVDGEWRFISFSGEPVFDRDKAFKGYRGIARDVTQTRRAEERIRRLAHFDELTGLPNRTMFMHTLQRAFSLAQRRSKQFALFFIDLDRFKNINDSLGHEAGDRLLQDVARRLRHHLRESDTVARLGGDEFVVLVEDCADSARAQRDRAEHPERGRPAVYAVRPRVSRDRQHRHLDLSRRRARPRVAAQERGHRDVPREGPRQEQLPVLLAQQNAHSFERLALESALRHALERREFVLHYQPKIDIRTNRIVGVEALLRWNHPDLGTVTPNQFIPLAEETGPHRADRAAGCCAPRARRARRGAATDCPACASR